MTTAAAITILVVEDSALVRHGIRAAIESESGRHRLKIVGEAGTAHGGLTMAQKLQPNVVLLDLRLPDDNGVNVCRKLRQLLPKTCVLILTSSTDDHSVYESVVAGAHGYLLKEIDPAGLVKAIADGHAGRPVFASHVATSVINIVRKQHAKPAEISRVSLLSPQELRVLEAIAAGHSNKGIAVQLKLSENTVKNYIANMFQKLGIERRAQAVALYLGTRPPPTR
jgi:two-component system response regulator DevR